MATFLTSPETDFSKKKLFDPPFYTLSNLSVRPGRGGGKMGKFPPPHFRFELFFQFEQIRREKIFEGIPPRPPNFRRFVVHVMKQVVKMFYMTCEFFFVSNIY